MSTTNTDPRSVAGLILDLRSANRTVIKEVERTMIQVQDMILDLDDGIPTSKVFEMLARHLRVAAAHARLFKTDIKALDAALEKSGGGKSQ